MLNTKNQKATPEEARRAYQREWRLRNKDRVRAYNERFWKKKAAELESQQAETASE